MWEEDEMDSGNSERTGLRGSGGESAVKVWSGQHV